MVRPSQEVSGPGAAKGPPSRRPGLGLALDPAGDAYVAGYTNSTILPTTAGGFRTVNAGGYDAFVSKVAARPNPPKFTSVTTRWPPTPGARASPRPTTPPATSPRSPTRWAT